MVILLFETHRAVATPHTELRGGGAAEAHSATMAPACVFDIVACHAPASSLQWANGVAFDHFTDVNG